MSDMKCPFCQQELVRHWGMKEPALYCCDNPKCSRGGVATESAWQELIHTGKALDKAKNGLKELRDIIACPPDVSYETGASMYADGVLQEITTLEQKE